MNNASIHINSRVKEVIEQHDCQIRYLPPYSPDFNPIELSFSMLKAWVREHLHRVWLGFESDFGALLSYTMTRSRCDRFAMEHSRHITYGRLIFQSDLRALNERLATRGIDLT